MGGATTAVSDAPSAPVHVLVVDDDPGLRRSLARVLSARGFRVGTAEDGVGGLAYLDENGPDVALVDMQMPGLDGGKTIMALRHIRPELPIIGASGLATNQNREQAAANGVRHFLDKPFSVETLIRTVHAAMAKTAT